MRARTIFNLAIGSYRRWNRDGFVRALERIQDSEERTSLIGEERIIHEELTIRVTI